jgi:VWFA-related protein
MRNLTLVSLSVFALAAGAAPAGYVQQTTSNVPSDQPVATLHMNVREVVLPVTVRDKHGALVTSLGKSDFSLTEDGRPQTIKSFAHETNLPFRIGLLVDTSRSVSKALESERKAAETFVDSILPAPPAESKDQAFLIHFDREVELLQDFTNSRDKLHHELDDMSASPPPTADASEGPETTDSSNSSARRRRGGTQLYDAIFLAADELMKEKDGRKALVLFSDGGDRGSKETLNDAVDAADRANLAVYTIFFKGEQEQQTNGMPGGRRGGMGGSYPGGGGGWPGSGGGGRRGGGQEPRGANGVDGKKIMQEIASRTGGHAYEAKNPKDLDAIYKQIEEELRSQYLMTYTPDKVDTEGGFHKIVLKASKDYYIVSTREGYYAPEK